MWQSEFCAETAQGPSPVEEGAPSEYAQSEDTAPMIQHYWIP